MAEQRHIELLLEGVEAWNRRREQEDFTPDLSGAGLYEANLANANLSHACLINTNLFDTNLFNTNLFKAQLIGASLTDANLTSANLRNAILTNAELFDSDLIGADLSHSEPWEAKLYSRSTDEGTIQGAAGEAQEDKKKIKSIECLLQECRDLRDKYKNKKHSDNILFYFRGESRIFERENRTPRKLRPSVMRSSPEGEFPLRKSEGEILLDLMSRQPEAFSGLTSAIGQWVLAQHHELRTRLLDITRNPLVALFNVCKKYDTQDGSDRKDGRLHVFAVPRDLIKPFNSDRISIIANFFKLRQNEQDLLLGKESDSQYDYAEVMDRLYHFIGHEKPYFMKKIDPRDLFRVFVVEPQRSFERIRAQSGAFLISAFHEQFESSKILEQNAWTPVYHHYTLTVSGKKKKCIMKELRLLNITHESLFPGLDEAAEAVIQRFSSKKLANS